MKNMMKINRFFIKFKVSLCQHQQQGVMKMG